MISVWLEGYSSMNDLRYGEVTERIIEIDKLHEVMESEPGSMEVSQWSITLNNFDDWFKNVFSTYINRDDIDVKVHIQSENYVLWAGYLYEKPVINNALKTVKFNFKNILGYVLKKERQASSEDRSFSLRGLILRAFGDDPAVQTRLVGPPSINLDWQYYVPDSGQTYYGWFGFGDTRIHADGLTDRPVSCAEIIKQTAIMFNGAIVFYQGGFYFINKTGFSTIEIIDITNILEFEILSYAWDYDGVLLEKDGTWSTNHSAGIIKNEEKTLKHDVYLFGHAHLEQEFPFNIWNNIGPNAAKNIYNFHKDLKRNFRLVLDGVDYWIGQRLLLPRQVSDLTDYVIVVSEMWKDFSNDTTEIIGYQ